MAKPTYDAIGGTSWTTTLTTTSWTHVCTGSYLYLRVALLLNAAVTSPTVTYNSVSVPLVSTLNVVGSTQHLYIFELIAPTSGSYTVSASWTGSKRGVGVSLSYANVNQTTWSSAWTQLNDQTSSPLANSVSPSANDIGIDFCGTYNSGGAALPTNTAGGSQSSRGGQTSSNSSGQGGSVNLTSSDENGTGGSISMSWTITGTYTNGALATAILYGTAAAITNTGILMWLFKYMEDWLFLPNFLTRKRVTI